MIFTPKSVKIHMLGNKVKNCRIIFPELNRVCIHHIFIPQFLNQYLWDLQNAKTHFPEMNLEIFVEYKCASFYIDSRT